MTITASAPGIATPATAQVSVVPPPTINVPQSTPLNLGQSVSFPVTLSAPAPSPVTVTLTISDPSKVTLSQTTVTIAQGQTMPVPQPTVTGIFPGATTITASAPNYLSGSGTVAVTAPTIQLYAVHSDDGWSDGTKHHAESTRWGGWA